MGNIFTNPFAKKDIKLLMGGLDGAGKTTILYKLKLGVDLQTTIPTNNFNVETVVYKNYKLTIWDFGGIAQLRPLWRHYLPHTQGLIFVVDSNDRTRIDYARERLVQTLWEDELQNTILLIFANKNDLPDAMNDAEITEKLALNSLKNDKWHVQTICATSGDGLREGFDWMSKELKKIKH